MLWQPLDRNFRFALPIPFARNRFNVLEGKFFVAQSKLVFKQFSGQIRCFALPLFRLIDDDAKEPSPKGRLLAEILE